jgi:hypothetical protein
MRTKATAETDPARQTVNRDEETGGAHPHHQSMTIMSVARSGAITGRRDMMNVTKTTRNATAMKKEAAVTERAVRRQTQSTAVAAATRTSIAPRAPTATAAGNIVVATAPGHLQAKTNTTRKTRTRATVKSLNRVLVASTEATRISHVIVIGHATESAIVIDATATAKTETRTTNTNVRAIDPKTRQRTEAVVGSERQRRMKGATTMTGTVRLGGAGETAIGRTGTATIVIGRNVIKKTATTANPSARLRKTWLER